MLEPTLVHREHIRSTTGDEVHASVVGLSMTAPQIMNALVAGDWQWMFEKIRTAALLLKREGCRVIGFGGHTSILTGNCQRLPIEGVALTSGNSLTVGLGVRALKAAARAKGIALGSVRLAVVGGAGNIASAYAAMMAPEVQEVVLVVRHASATVERIRNEVGRLAPRTRVVVSTDMKSLRQ